MIKIVIFLLAPLFLFSNYKSYGISIDGNLKYKKDFSHFEYTNPNAPKGGHLKRASIGTFDSFNHFIIKGTPANYLELIYDTLMTSSMDEKMSNYPLLAHSIEIDKNKKWVRFYLRKEASFSDGHPLRAEDVKFSFDILIKQGSPFYRKYYKDIKNAKVISPLIIEFNLSNPNNKELPLIIGHIPILPKHYWDKKDFSKTTLNPPMGSGAYIIDKFKAGAYITYKRNKNYWGKNLPTNKGIYNFDKITISYFRDDNVAFEAFKSGVYDLRLEYRAKKWVTAYKGVNFRNKNIIKEAIKHSNPQGMQGFIFNTRKDTLKDINIRKALNYAFDFEWSNKNLFFHQYKRTNSFFENSNLKASGLPSKEELELLNPIKQYIPKEVFTKEFALPINKGDGNIRGHLRVATKLLRESNYIIKNGKLVNKQTLKPLVIEALIFQEGFLKILLPFKKNLKALGIELKIKRVDLSQYVNRLRGFDYDIIVSSYGQANWLGNEQRYYWHSSSADVKGSRNYIGIKNKGIDILVQKLINSKDQREQQNIARALDRVLLWNYFVIPNWYIDKYRVAYWKKIHRPSIAQKYGFSINHWWIDTKEEESINKILNK